MGYYNVDIFGLGISFESDKEDGSQQVVHHHRTKLEEL